MGEPEMNEAAEGEIRSGVGGGQSLHCGRAGVVAER